jgi:hypothetical protein
MKWLYLLLNINFAKPIGFVLRGSWLVFAAAFVRRRGLDFLNAPHINNRQLKTSPSYAKLKLNRRVGRQRQPIYFLPCERRISAHRGACIN